MGKTLENSEDETLDNVVAESGSVYSSTNKRVDQLYINPFVDWAFKRIFASEAHKEVIIAFLNEVLQGKRQIQSIVYTKNEYPGEIEEEGGCVFDFACTDFDGTSFLVEVQKQKQEHFKERSLFYAGRLLSDQAPKGDKTWKYKLKEVYSISLLEGFCLPDTSTGAYQHNVCLCNTSTGQPFYDKLHFIYIEVLKFTKKEGELSSALDQWLYALKHAATMKQKPLFLNAPELKTFFELANYAKLTKEERNMYRTAQQREWDNYSILDYAKKEGREEGALANRREIALEMVRNGYDFDSIVNITKLSKEQIQEL